MGLISQALRAIKKQIKALFDQIFGRFRKKPAEDELEIPGSWVKEPESPMSKSSEPMERRPSSLVIRRKKFRIRWLLSFKRLMAGVLIIFNFGIGEYMLSIGGQGMAAFFVMFLGNAFILADYLWKTRSKESQK